MAIYDYKGGHEAEDLVREIFRITGHPQAEVARYLGCTPPTLSDKMVNGTIKANLFLKIIRYCGVEIKFFDKETGKEITPVRTQNEGHGRKVQRTVKGVTYNTGNSIALSNSFYEDGEHEYNADGIATELYRGKDGEYFIAEFNADASIKEKFTRVSAEKAALYIQEHGTNLHKENK